MSGNFGFSAFAHIDNSFAQSEPRAQPNNGNPRMCKNAATDGSLSPHIACIGHMRPQTEQDRIAVKIGRARLSGPSQVTKDATVAELDASGKITILAIGTNEWVCFPGNENEIGNVPMSCDRMGLQWLKDLLEGKPAPTNKAPGLIYMLCGATQRSVTNPYDKDSAAIPIGPHYMIMWPFDSVRHGMPTNVRDAGAWVMYDGTPWAHLHVCGSPWDGTVYHHERAPNPIWSLKYAASNEDSQQTGF